MSKPCAVVGATGGQGGAVVDALLERGIPVRALVRRVSARTDALQQRGVEIRKADITDRSATTDAFTGVAGVFAMTTPFEDGPEAEIAQGQALVDALVAANVPHVVFSSVADADRSTGIPHFETKARTEAILRASTVPFTIVGPTYFYDNMLGGIEDVRRGRLDLPLPVDTPLQQMSRRDLGRFVALVLSDPSRFLGARIDLASDDPTPAQMAAALGAALGTTVTAHSYDAAAISSPDMRAMFQFLTDTGYDANIDGLRRKYPEIGWQRFTDWLAELG
ncbi:NmrA/HSCARG family protein [Rhodococcus sp. RS1C4]|uniref:NmrA/HSCARG family protein n=1 Tax=Nocardiaceae TaxID=85025 RepID=UPI000522F14D|nr:MULTISPECIES: NmrA/HSCARG family protein [Rhodococcus]OZC53420.1 NmrA/HSCARG family protein [Rhodococcus sp. RS1C4]OZD11562.1 NmrA/HSCARG family protein [Rhodococcus sp. 06-156-3C]OZD13797.1 NmrA/HSCARG family protein [Rhodococcus sp. 06-156-4a]OZD22233.1 NmrA/HSCARG family protein [Rhodococcus sp. 06-156-4C]OZD30424.1 NmrA/HSCARG family protein [Rhodococcus sp. 06-156-3]